MQMLMLARVFACLVALQDGTELHEVVVHEHREPIEVAREIYPDLRADIAELEGSTFLEDEHNVLLALLYLSTISPGNKKVPWTQDDDRVFRDAERAVERTSFWLKWGLLLLVPLACFGLLGLFVLVPENNEASVVSYVVTVTVCVTVSTVLVTVLAFFYTGIFPDTSSIKANDRQNAVGALKEKYRGFGTDLLRIHAQHPDLAVAIASTVDVPHLRDLLVRRTHDTYAAFIFTDFQEAHLEPTAELSAQAVPASVPGRAASRLVAHVQHPRTAASKHAARPQAQAQAKAIAASAIAFGFGRQHERRRRGFVELTTTSPPHVLTPQARTVDDLSLLWWLLVLFIASS